MMTAAVWTAATVMTAFLSIPTFHWSQMKKAGVINVAGWSRGSRLSTLRRSEERLVRLVCRITVTTGS